MKRVRKEHLGSFIQGLLEEFEVLAPVKKEKAVEFARIDHAEEICLGASNARIPPKNLFFPQSEVLFHFEKKDAGFQLKSTEGSEKRRVILGARPCDVQALSILDCVFDGDLYRDPYYLTKREKTAIFAIGCNQPASTCFCSSMESGPFSRKGADVFMTDIGQAYVIEPLTPKGNQIMEREVLEDPSREDLKAARETEHFAKRNIISSVERAGLDETLDQIADSGLWWRIHEKCIGCGLCTFLCPTCHCFDIVDEGQEARGERVRFWDSCLFPLYTQETSGHNPRPTGSQRMRQRIMHKFNYFIKSYGRTACVGCGRCVKYCPVNLDIRKVIEEIRDQKSGVIDQNSGVRSQESE